MFTTSARNISIGLLAASGGFFFAVMSFVASLKLSPEIDVETRRAVYDAAVYLLIGAMLGLSSLYFIEGHVFRRSREKNEEKENGSGKESLIFVGFILFLLFLGAAFVFNAGLEILNVIASVLNIKN